MKFRNRIQQLGVLLAGSLIVPSIANAQDCPPPTIPLTSTVRTLDSGQITVEGVYSGDTREVLSVYEYPAWGENQIGTMNVTGSITFTNKSTQNRKMTYRMSVLLPEGSIPQFTDLTGSDGSALCWEETDRRIVVVYEISLDAGLTREVPVNWSATMRGLLFADLNNDLRVDGLDQLILLNNFGTSNVLSDLNNDGIVNQLDLDILLLNWSDYSDDVIETSDATPTDPNAEVGPNGRLLVSGVESPAVSNLDPSGNFFLSDEQFVSNVAQSMPFYNTASFVIAGLMKEDPLNKSLPIIRQGPYTIPFQDWQRST